MQESTVSRSLFTSTKAKYSSFLSLMLCAVCLTVPAFGQVLVNEIMYNPSSGKAEHEFIEILNTGGAAVNLRGWSLSEGVQFDFPDVTLGTGDYLVVNFATTDTLPLNAFMSAYGLTPGNLTLYGPYAGNLSNRGERVALVKAEAPDESEDPTAWVLVDEVIYFEQAPFPPEPDGGGQALIFAETRKRAASRRSPSEARGCCGNRPPRRSCRPSHTVWTTTSNFPPCCTTA